MKQSHLITLLTLLTLALAARCTSPTPAPTVTPECTKDGHVEQLRIESPTLGWDIDFETYLPPCYEEHTWASYPVLVLIPGNSSAASSWNSVGTAEIANRMIRNGEIPPFILVTPANYPRDSHGQALLNDLFPYVEENFRTLTDRKHRAVGGASLGGVMAYRLVFQHPDLFGSLGIFGSGVVGGDEGNVDGWIAAMPREQWPRVLIDYGDNDLAMATNAQRTMDILDAWEIPYTLNVGHGGHNVAYWVSNMEMYLRWYAEDW